MNSSGMPVSPALTASKASASAIPEASLNKGSNAPTPSIAPASKKTTPKQGDSFAASLGYGGKDCEPLASVTDVPGEDAAGAMKLMKNLLYAPTHKSYEKMPQTKGHAATSWELGGNAFILPALCRDSTKFARPIVPVMWFKWSTWGVSANLTYVVYGNDAPAGKPNYIMYNLDPVHGVALSANVRKYAPEMGNWCKRNLVDHQVKYILTMLRSKANVEVQTGCMDVYKLMESASNMSPSKLSVRLLVVDGLEASSAQALRHAFKPDLLPAEYDEDSPEHWALEQLGVLAEKCNDTYVNKQDLYTLTDAALLKTQDRFPKPAPAPEPAPASPKKRQEALDTSDDSDSDEPLAPPPKKPKPAEKPPAPAPAPAPAPVPKKKKKAMSDDDEEDEMSGSGSDVGSNSESDDDSESEEEDSEEEEDDSDDDEPKKKPPKTAEKPMPVATTPGGTATAPAPADEPARLQMRQTGTGKIEKEKRKPAKSRRQSMEKTISGILRQGKGLDDAVPAQNNDKLCERMSEVEKTLRPFVEEGKVVHVHELLHASWGLVSELFTIVNAIGRAGGPAPPDSRASRELAVTMGRLVDNESKDIEDLSRDIAGWASKMLTILATRAQVAAQVEQASRQLVPPAPN